MGKQTDKTWDNWQLMEIFASMGWLFERTWTQDAAVRHFLDEMLKLFPASCLLAEGQEHSEAEWHAQVMHHVARSLYFVALGEESERPRDHRPAGKVIPFPSSTANRSTEAPGLGGA